MNLAHFIAGEAPAVETPLSSINPSDTREIVANFPNGGAAEVDRAVQAARAAFPAWSAA